MAQVGGLFRVVARTAAVVRDENQRPERNSESIGEYVHERTFTDNGEAWKLALRVEQAIKAGGTLDLRHWDVVNLGELPADPLLPAR